VLTHYPKEFSVHRVNSNHIPMDESVFSDEERSGLTLLAETEKALREVLSGQRLRPVELDRLLAD
jgi:hypothetical protein